MASIKGINIEIGGNTTKLTEALKNVNKVVYSTNADLRDLNKALKLDPKNTEALALKQKLLKDNISATVERVNKLREAQEQMGDVSKLTDEQKEKYKNLSIEIAKSEGALKKMNDELESIGKDEPTKGLNDGIEKVGITSIRVGDLIKANLISEGIIAGIKTAEKAVKKLASTMLEIGKSAISSYADYEQLVGGVETLFKDSAGIVKEYANNAYKTAGLSANEYMETVTSFSASLIQSLDGDTQKAAEYSNRAITDMSDNANKMGTSMEMIQNAYQGFAKQNYTMLD